MSRESVEIVRAGLDAWNRRDWDAALAQIDPDVEWHLSGAVPDLPGSYYGHQGVREFWRAWTGAWAQITADVERLIDLGDNVLVLAHFRAGSRDEITVDQPVAFLFTLRGGMVVRFKSYWDREEAFAAVSELDVRSNPDALAHNRRGDGRMQM
jgi:ketosteroid isomerase-like protein